jgi:hypothetical protein
MDTSIMLYSEAQRERSLIYRLTHPPVYCGNSDCKCSTNNLGSYSLGSGVVDKDGLFAKPCETHARDWENRFPEDYPCWPYDEKTAKSMEALIKEYACGVLE